MTLNKRLQTKAFATLVIAFLSTGIPCGTFAADSDANSLEFLFSLEHDIVSENFANVILQASRLPAAKRFDFLADWVLPTRTRTAFRMNSKFVQTDPAPGSNSAPHDSTVDGISSPVFSLLAVAQQTSRLAELRQRVEAIADPSEAHDLRAKTALLFMIDVARSASNRQATFEESASATLESLSMLVRARDTSIDEHRWPETLAIAYGIQNAHSKREMLELVTSIYYLQIAELDWTKNAAWDVFNGGAFARLSAGDESDTESDSLSPNSFKHWKPAAVVTSESRGNGFAVATWRSAGNVVHKVVGHNNDYLYFPSPLSGDFEIHCDVTGKSFRETQLSYAGVFASHHSRLSVAEIGGVRDQTMLPLDPPMTAPDEWLSCRVLVRNSVCSHFINGRLILQRTLVDGENPWVALRAHRLSHGAIRNLTITGSPKIPDTVDMVKSPKLVGWFSYFDEAVDDADDSSAWRTLPVQDSAGSFEIHHATSPGLSGSNLESLLMYHRPIMEDGSIEYEFYYTPDKTIVHPAIDRIAFLLEPDGVKTHWVTDGLFQSDDLSPANRAVDVENRLARTQLSLQANSWNHLEIAIKDDVVQIILNGTSVVERALEASNRRQFGLFDFADKTSVRVRNIRWTGDWPKADELSDLVNSVNPDTAEIERLASLLPKSYRQELSNLKIDSGHFIKRGGPIAISPRGIAMESNSTKADQQTDLPLWLEVGGDFDLRATFQDFRHAEVGDGALEMLAHLPSDAQKIRVSRHRWDNIEQKLRTRFSSMTNGGQATQRANDHWLANESTSGTFRMVRIGTTVHYMFAENDSTNFRLLSTDKVGRGPLNAGGITLTAYSKKGGSASAKWTSVSVRAEQITGVAVPDMQALRDQLDAAKKQLPKSVVHDFTKTAPNAQTFTRMTDLRPWNPQDAGLDCEMLASNAGGRVEWPH